MNLNPNNLFVFKDNQIFSCSSAGIYVQGKQSKPIVTHNLFQACKCPSIIINTSVDAFIGMNSMEINEFGIELLNNRSIVFENTIQKSLIEGIIIKC